IPYVTTDGKNHTTEPTPTLNDCCKLLRVTINTPKIAPINSPAIIPARGITNGPINKPIVLHHIPAFVPLNFFTSIRFEIVSAANNSATNSSSITQNHHGNSVKL